MPFGKVFSFAAWRSEEMEIPLIHIYSKQKNLINVLQTFVEYWKPQNLKTSLPYFAN